ncbi:MAG TPA: hypothetical protein VK061_10170 [Bacillota bacterium]|nr:hypothetical protein [Bacillota bacterium]
METNESFIEWFLEEAKKQNVHLQFILREDLQIGLIDNRQSLTYQGKPITIPNFAVVRTVEPLLNKHLETLGIRTFNSYEISSLCNHKMKTYYAMNKLKIPVMNTLSIKRNHKLDKPPFPFPFVLKEATGRGGEQVHFVKNEQMWDNIFAKLTTEDVVIQTTNVQLGKDLRVYVMGKDILCAILRESKGKFRANFTLGGSATLYELSQAEKRLIKKIVNHYDFDFVGIDFLINHEGNLVLNEIEDVVGSRMISAVTDINTLELYVSHIKRQLS